MSVASLIQNSKCAVCKATAISKYLKTLESYIELQSWVINLCWLVTVSEPFHITRTLFHCSYKNIT